MVAADYYYPDLAFLLKVLESIIQSREGIIILAKRNAPMPVEKSVRSKPIYSLYMLARVYN